MPLPASCACGTSRPRTSSSRHQNHAMGERGRRRYVPAEYLGHLSEAPDLGDLPRSKLAVHRFAPPANFESAAGDVGLFRRQYRDTSWKLAGPADHDDSSGLEVHALRPADVGYSRNTQRAVSTVLQALGVPTHSQGPDTERPSGQRVQFEDWERRGYFIPLRKDFGVCIACGPYPKQITSNGSRAHQASSMTPILVPAPGRPRAQHRTRPVPRKRLRSVGYGRTATHSSSAGHLVAHSWDTIS